jgi:DNA sulfur modification protein DndC
VVIPANPPVSALAGPSVRAAVAVLVDEIRTRYLADRAPWVVGYSGGKDSTAVLQLVWTALAGLRPDQRSKPVHVISTDTRVENPIVSAWVTRSHDAIRVAAGRAGLPIVPHRLTPAVDDSFWVNLIGRGYAAPRHKFRWCTDRLKIRPSTAFIRSLSSDAGATFLVLGTRKAESQARARSMERLEERRLRDGLPDRVSPNAGLPGSRVYTPIEAWTNQDVWTFLMQESNHNPWGHDNKDLLALYSGASADGECPLVIDTSTPSCGKSRFGCWVCTMVDKDRSMQAMIHNSRENEWMIPLLELRDALGVRDDRGLRDFRRSSGRLQIYKGRLVHGPYTQPARERWLRRLLSVEREVRAQGPEHMRDVELISPAELHAIRRIWVLDKHEIEDSLPRIYEEAKGAPYPGPPLDAEPSPFSPGDVATLRDACQGDDLHFRLARELLSLEHRHPREGLHEALEKALRRGFYTSEGDAEQIALARLGASPALRKKRRAARGRPIPLPRLAPDRFRGGLDVVDHLVADLAAIEERLRTAPEEREAETPARIVACSARVGETLTRFRAVLAEFARQGQPAMMRCEASLPEVSLLEDRSVPTPCPAFSSSMTTRPSARCSRGRSARSERSRRPATGPTRSGCSDPSGTASSCSTCTCRSSTASSSCTRSRTSRGPTATRRSTSSRPTSRSRRASGRSAATPSSC